MSFSYVMSSSSPVMASRYVTHFWSGSHLMTTLPLHNSTPSGSSKEGKLVASNLVQSSASFEILDLS